MKARSASLINVPAVSPECFEVPCNAATLSTMNAPGMHSERTLPSRETRLQFRNFANKLVAVPRTRVVLYREEDGACPFLAWFDKLPAKAQDKCYLRLERLRDMGHELRRPEADFLRDGIHELRVSLQGVLSHSVLLLWRRRGIRLTRSRKGAGNSDKEDQSGCGAQEVV